MTPSQMAALQEYMSALVWFMLNHTSGGGNIHRYLAAKERLEKAFGVAVPTQAPKSDFPDIL